MALLHKVWLVRMNRPTASKWYIVSDNNIRNVEDPHKVAFVLRIDADFPYGWNSARRFF